MFEEKGKDLSDYASTMLDHESEEEGIQSITSNIHQHMTGKIAISARFLTSWLILIILPC